MPNYSVLGLAAYYIISVIPHAYSIGIITRANNGQWNNSNPRSSKFSAKLQSTVPADTFAAYERAASAHKNGMENLPLVVGAVALGNMAHLDVGFLNQIMGWYLASRVLYTLLYIGVSNISLSFTRSLTWFAGTSLMLWTIIRAGQVFMGQE